ncbi:MAG: sigma-70 region 4 domain-containing protein, partial [Planctomycetes bacterium]|nr:sigma-70 region 4 domain-containing protein [Planctomycetota bacterium]
KPEYREAIRLARIEGLKVKEIAERLGKSPGAVKHLLARGLKELRRRFGETESFHLPDRNLRMEEGDHGE